MTWTTCCRFWTAEDAAADADEIKITSETVSESGTDGAQKDIVIEVKEQQTEQDNTEAPATAVPSEDVDVHVVDEAQEEIPQAEAIREVPPTAEEVASAVDVEKVSKSKEVEVAPSASTTEVEAMKPDEPQPEVEAMKRVDADLTEGGLLLTQVMGGRQAIRRLEIEGDSGILKWEVEAVFGMKWEKVKLAESRIMCTGNLVKIGAEGRSRFLTFEACDDDEAAAVCNALVDHAKKHKCEDPRRESTAASAGPHLKREPDDVQT